MLSRLKDLKEKFVFLQRKILDLEEDNLEKTRQSGLLQDRLLLEKIELLDVFENLSEFNQVTALRIKRRLLRQLEDQKVFLIHFPDNKAVLGKSKIVETEPRPELEPGTILSVIKTGYEQAGRVLRPAELITSG